MRKKRDCINIKTAGAYLSSARQNSFTLRRGIQSRVLWDGAINLKSPLNGHSRDISGVKKKSKLESKQGLV
jgi:hypothetical protein